MLSALIGAVDQLLMSPLRVVPGVELVDQGLHPGDTVRIRALVQPPEQGLVEPFIFALGCRLAGLPVIIVTPSGAR